MASIPFLSKIIEKVVGFEICSFLGDPKPPLQSAYFKNHSMEMAFTCVLNDILRNLDYCHGVVLVILDLVAGSCKKHVCVITVAPLTENSFELICY